MGLNASFFDLLFTITNISWAKVFKYGEVQRKGRLVKTTIESFSLSTGETNNEGSVHRGHTLEGAGHKSPVCLEVEGSLPAEEIVVTKCQIRGSIVKCWSYANYQVDLVPPFHIHTPLKSIN